MIMITSQNRRFVQGGNYLLSVARRCAAAAALCTASSVYATDWTYDSSAKTITDGGWIIKCTYTVGAKAISLSTVSTVAADGILDLRNMTVTSGSTAALITSITFTSNWDNNVAVKELYADCVTKLPRLYTNKSIEKVVVANPLLTSIQGNQFFNATKLVSDISDIVAPGVTSIGTSAFNGSKVRGKLTLTAVNTINETAFKGSMIEDVDITSSALTSMGDAFYHCTALTNANISCAKLTSLSGTFGYCSKLRRVSLACPVLSTIGKASFRNTSVLSVNISGICPSTVTSVGESAFNSCPAVGKVTLPNLASLGVDAFNGCKISDVEIGGSLVTIPKGCFYNCTSLKDVTINCPNATTIAAQAFQYANSLTRMTLACPALASVDATSFANGASPMSLTIMNDPWVVSETDHTASIIDNVLVVLQAVSSSRHAVVYADKAVWKGYAAALTEAEKGYAPAKTYGVYVTAGGVRKAFFVHPAWAKSPGMIVIMR